jgi:hypothetical protein
MMIFHGVRGPGRCQVFWQSATGAVSMELPACNHLRNHSPDGFEWGYAGSGPAQLALAILVKVAGPDVALRLYQRFKFDVVCNLAKASWRMTELEVLEWLELDNAWDLADVEMPEEAATEITEEVLNTRYTIPAEVLQAETE